VFAVEKGSPAERAGFRVGDVLIAVNGFDPMTARARATLRGPGLPNAIRVRRGVTELTLTLTPTTPKPPATGKR
jgi:S1-C subfamily serine protease